jgi:HPt (histidine-containing phosphotransfer) domain-containing protein
MECGMNAIVVPKPAKSKYFDRQKAANAIEPVFTDAPRGARRELPKTDRLFDAQAALDRAAGNRDLLRNMVGLFSRQWRERLAEIASATSRRDGAALELVANRLKRSLGSVGAGQASRVAQELEELGGKRGFHDSKKKHAELGIEIERLVSALKEFSKETIPAGSR